MTKRTPLLIFSFFLLLLGALFMVAGPSTAAPLPQQPAPTPSDDQVNRVAKQLFCPVCENIPLDVCPTQACHDWRELIRQKLAQGWSDEQIKTYFAQQYGDRVLAEPPRSGLNWLVYVVPPLGILIGGVIVWRVLASMRRRAPNAPGSPASSNPVSPTSADPSQDPYLARLEEELRNKD